MKSTLRLKLFELVLARAFLRKYGFVYSGVDREITLVRQALSAAPNEPGSADEAETKILRVIWEQFVEEWRWLGGQPSSVAQVLR